MNITLHTRITRRQSNQGKLQSSKNLNILEHEWNDKAVIHSHKEYNKSILKPVVDHSNPSNALLFRSLRMAYIKPKVQLCKLTKLVLSSALPRDGTEFSCNSLRKIPPRDKCLRKNKRLQLTMYVIMLTKFQYNNSRM